MKEVKKDEWRLVTKGYRPKVIQECTIETHNAFAILSTTDIHTPPDETTTAMPPAERIITVPSQGMKKEHRQQRRA